MRRIVLLLAVSLVAIATLQTPLQAACGSASVIGTVGGPGQQSWVFSRVFADDPNYQFYYGVPTVYGSPTPPLNSSLRATFWRLGSGDPTVGLGNDNGAFDLVASGGIQSYQLPSYLFYQAAEVVSGWSDPSVDGCIDGGNCQCLLLSEQDGADTYLAILSAQSEATTDTFFNRGGADGEGNELPIILEELQRPAILSTSRLPDFTVLPQVRVDTPTANIYAKDGCDCSPIGYRVLQIMFPRGTNPATVSRDIAEWSPVALSDGQPQGITPIGDTVTVRSECGNVDRDVYLAAQLIFPDGFELPYVTKNSAWIQCGPNLADPADRPKPIRPMGPRNRRPTNPRRR